MSERMRRKGREGKRRGYAWSGAYCPSRKEEEEEEVGVVEVVGEEDDFHHSRKK